MSLLTRLKYQLFGNIFKNFNIKVSCLGKWISNCFVFVRPSNIFSAAYSTVFKKGILKSFLSVIGVLINPGEIKETLTPYLLKSKNKLSARLFNADFEGPYPVEFGNPLEPAIEDTIDICPFFLSL